MSARDVAERILIVDDDPDQRELLSSFLAGSDFVTECAGSAKAALKLLESSPPSMMITDVRMPGMSGLDLLREARKHCPSLPVLIVTAYPDVRGAVGAIRDGAVNYLQKPLDFDELLSSVQSVLGLAPSPKGVEVDYDLPPDVIAESAQMHDVLREAALVARSNTRVLITGESGTGKEVIARLVHTWSDRSSAAMLFVNCAAIPEPLLEAELFGHERGAFSHAYKQRVGRFEEADGGTLFLDEVSEMSQALQAKLLRVTQDGVFQRLGSNKDRRSDARVIAATNRDLSEEVSAGRFREDLFYRLNVVELWMPPLRERQADIMPLAHFFVGKASGAKPRFSSSVIAGLSAYPWPGNVRELQNAMERSTLMARGDIIMPEHLPRHVMQAAGAPSQEADGQRSEGRLKEVERSVILQTLNECGHNRTEASKVLGISRRALIYKLRRFAEEGYDVQGS